MPSRYTSKVKKFSCGNKECVYVEHLTMSMEEVVDVEGKHYKTNYEELDDRYVHSETKCPKCGSDMILEKPKYSGICGYNPKLCDFNADGTPGPLHWKRSTSFRKQARVYMNIEDPY